MVEYATSRLEGDQVFRSPGRFDEQKNRPLVVITDCGVRRAKSPTRRVQLPKELVVAVPWAQPIQEIQGGGMRSGW